MRRITALAVSGLLLIGPQFAAAAPGDAGGGTKSQCNAQWLAMAKAGTTGGQSRRDFLDRCEGRTGGGGGAATELALGVGAAGAAGLLIAAAAHHDHPASP
jgi:hypothetical protein